MSTDNQVVLLLKEKIESAKAIGMTDAETLRNILKEELQYYVLNFIYHHPEYSNWIMYGGSALRICHDLDRMSVDLDFEVTHKIEKPFLNELKNEIAIHFKNTYSLSSDLFTIKITTDRGLRLCFLVGDLVGLGAHSKQVIVKIDLNNFTVPKTVTERLPLNRNQLSFVIKTYNLSALMASKIAAIFLRGQRGGLGGLIYQEKGRDIYDLLWYMSKKIIPDLDYLQAKNIDTQDLRSLFDRLTLQMNKVTDKNLKEDLTPLFVNQIYIENWLKNWRESYFRLLKDYEIHTLTEFESVTIYQDFRTEFFSFLFRYRTENRGSVSIVCNLSDDWIHLKDSDWLGGIDNRVSEVTQFANNNAPSLPASQQKKLKQYATLFYEKIERYLKKTNKVILGESIVTKVIRMTADTFNPKEQIILNTSALLSCELDDLLK